MMRADDLGRVDLSSAAGPHAELVLARLKVNEMSLRATVVLSTWSCSLSLPACT